VRSTIKRKKQTRGRRLPNGMAVGELEEEQGRKRERQVRLTCRDGVKGERSLSCLLYWSTRVVAKHLHF
jgi:hypothetical protein